MGRDDLREKVGEAQSGDAVPDHGLAEPLAADSFWQVPELFNFTRDVIEAEASVNPGRLAMTFVDSYGVIDRRTYAQVAADGNRWAALLRSRGLVPGDRILVYVGQAPEWPGILLGALKAGIVSVPCSASLEAPELALRGEHSNAQLVVTNARGAAEIARLDVPVEVVFVEDVAVELRQTASVQPTHETASDDIAFILYTAGTTGIPKGATHTHGYTWALRSQAEHWLGAGADDLVWCTAETGRATAIWNVLLGPWSRGAAVMIHEDPFDVPQRLDLLQRLGVTILCQTPAEYRQLADIGPAAEVDLGRLRHVVSIGEPLEPEVIEAFEGAFGLTIRDGYGQTENTLLVANAPGTTIKRGSMGLATPGHDMAVIDVEGNEQPPGVEGELALYGRPPSLFLGYWNAPDETNAVFRGDWYLTGDRAVRDEDGYLWFKGRSDDAILGSGDRVDPAEVEGSLDETAVARHAYGAASTASGVQP